MKDFKGNEVKVGHRVVFTTMTYSQLLEGTVVSVNKYATVMVDGEPRPRIVRPKAIYVM